MSVALEVVAVVLGLVYLLLAIWEKRSCWIAGGLASGIFMVIFWNAGLPMQGLLQVFYVFMAALGWWRWGKDNDPEASGVSQVSWRYHIAVLSALALLSIATLLARDSLTDTQAILDTGSSWAGVLATWMVAQKKLEAWIYWIVIDALTAGLYLDAGLLASSGLYVVYTALAVMGWKQWRQSLHRRTSS